MVGRQGDWFYPNQANFQYDDLNRVTQVEQGTNGYIFARSHYQYDAVSREVATWRDEDNGLGNGRGERFEYEATNQLKNGWYNAQNVATGSPINAMRTTNYVYSADKLNRSSVNDSGSVSAYSPSRINQYISVGGNGLSYEGNFNQTGYGAQTTSFNAANQLISGNNPASGHSATFTYDGLGRCVRRTIDGVARLFTYDDWNPILGCELGSELHIVNC